MEKEDFLEFLRRVESLDLDSSNSKTTAHTSAVSMAWKPVLDAGDVKADQK